MDDPSAHDGSEEESDYLAAADVAEEYELGEAPPDSDDDMEEEDEVPGSLPSETEGPAPEDQADVTFTGHTKEVYCIAINPDPDRPNQMMTGGGDDLAYLWTLASTGDIEECLKLQGHTDTVSCVGFSHSGALAASGDLAGKVQVWNSSDGSPKCVLEGPEDIECMVWHNSMDVVLAGSSDGTLWMWLASNGSCMRVFAGHQAKVTSVLFTSSGKGIVSCSEDHTVRTWAPSTGECRHVFQGHGSHEGPVTCIASHPDPEHSPLVLSGSEDGTAKLYHAQNKKVLMTFVHSTPSAMRSETEEATFSVESVGFCHTHPWVATGGLDGRLMVWDQSTGACRQTCVHPAGITRLRWQPSSPLVYTSCADGALRIWDARTGECRRTFTGHKDMVLDFDVFFGDGTKEQALWIASASDDGTAKVFSFSAEEVTSAQPGFALMTTTS